AGGGQGPARVQGCGEPGQAVYRGQAGLLIDSTCTGPFAGQARSYKHSAVPVGAGLPREDEEEEGDAPELSRRPVVDLELCLGDEKRTVEVNLVDRSSFNYPLLVGAKALREFKAAVNPAKRFTAGKPDC
ncbi:RimK/LysX family protein, partial [Pseudomonas ceruminis]|uniref:putative ATP-dependent zinc protease n=2 Tax=Pseudomonas ceruminis TaxID=2740516 RepID=UPI00280ACD22